MADNGSDITRTSGTSAAPERPRRAHTYSRLTTALAVLAVATAGYTLVRLDSTHERLDQLSDTARKLEAERSVLEAEIKNLATRESQSSRELDRRLDALDAVPKQVEDVTASVEELRGRAEGPERAWSRAEALFLLELAQRRLALDHDVQTAVVALESADSRLAALRDATFTPVRQQIARELQLLRAVRQPDTTGTLARLASAEEQAASLPVKGIVATERTTFDRSALPEGMMARAGAIVRSTLSNLIVVRQVDDTGGSVVTAEEALLRRQHLQLLLFSARTAVARHDATGYRSSLAQARRWLAEFFDLSTAPAQALLEEIQALEPIDIDPPLPDISASLDTLRRTSPKPRGSESRGPE
jgi:uroporphyrin-III C-methyltransferase